MGDIKKSENPVYQQHLMHLMIILSSQIAIDNHVLIPIFTDDFSNPISSEMLWHMQPTMPIVLEQGADHLRS